MATYSFTDLNGETRFVGALSTTGTVGPTDPTPLNTVSPVGTITSGALPTVSLSSTTAAQVSTARDVTAFVAITNDGTNNAATCKVELSPNNSDFSTLATISYAAAINNLGAIVYLVPVRVPAGWWIKLTVTHAAITSTTYA